jgi:hypothetical protein
MAGNYPRKQTLFIFFICLILVLGTAIFVNGFPSTKKQVSYKNDSNKTVVVANDNTEVSGSPEWEKSFFDEQEKVSVKNTKNLEKVTPAKENLNPTDLFGRNFFTKYTELRQSGLTNNTSAVNNAVSELIGESLTGIKGPTMYTLKDIKSTTNINTESIRQYAQNLMSILGDWMPAKNEVEIATNALETGDMEKLKEIDLIITNYKIALNRLKATIVPETLALPHLDLINGISMQVFNAESLRKVDEDALTAIAAISLELKSLQVIANATKQMKVIFDLSGINFVSQQSETIPSDK